MNEKRALELLNSAGENAIDAGLEGVMIVATDGQETLTFPHISDRANPHVVTLWMLGAHLQHMEQAAQAAGGNADMEKCARDAIDFIEQYSNAEGAGL